jgi:hypothetical protein
MKLLLISLVAALSGCGTATVLSSTPRSVMVDATMDLAPEAAQLAEKECQKYGKHAQLGSKLNGHTSVFNCVD